ncbi:MAG: hypothetical protein HYX38_27655 [Rhodospirillales bacterium]|nr:hypothetical protein [Rhodospirillales bacterium]
MKSTFYSRLPQDLVDVINRRATAHALEKIFQYDIYAHEGASAQRPGETTDGIAKGVGLYSINKAA